MSYHVMSCHVAGDYIKDKYDGATEVRVNRRGRLQIKDPRFNKPTANDLVYIDDSPNYCIRNVSVGSLGKKLNIFRLRVFNTTFIAVK